MPKLLLYASSLVDKVILLLCNLIYISILDLRSLPPETVNGDHPVLFLSSSFFINLVY